MTIKEKLETIKGKKIAIWCVKEHEAIIIHKYLDSSFDFKHGTYWNNNGMSTCYDFANNKYIMYCNIDWYRSEGYETILFRDFFKDFDLSNEIEVELSQSDVNTILDEKYGKGNWVIK